MRMDWDSTSATDNEKVLSTDTLEACQAACEQDPECLQGNLNGTECRLNTESFVLGTPRSDVADGFRCSSFWNKERIAQRVASLGSCGKVDYPLVT